MKNTEVFRRAMADLIVEMAHAGIGRVSYGRGQEGLTNVACALLDAAAKVSSSK
jgi:hypothetical protein